MREILFKGKRVDNGEWVEGCLLIDGVTGQYFIHGSGNCLNESDKVGQEGFLMFVAFEVDTNTVCQYTGLTDNNGQKIFEGDIIKYTDEVIGKEKIDQIEYNETHASFVRLHTSQIGLQYLFFDECIANKCEAIGNIFDNPELLKYIGC